MRQLTYKLVFHTPAFLGNAEQSAQWRTPPVKALLRQFWRMAFAASHPGSFSLAAMRREEGLLFGHAWLEDDHDSRGRTVKARRSQVRLRLSEWRAGSLSAGRWAPLPVVKHREVGAPVASDLYLGYGPVGSLKGSREIVLKRGAAINAGEHALLSIACPDAAVPEVMLALSLMDRYGTLGGRSRNGWGSFSLIPESGAPELLADLPASVTLPWVDALKADWPQAIGTDDKGLLVWQTASQPDWRSAMVELARSKIQLRTRFEFPQQRPDGLVHERHWLSYPVTNHVVTQWANQSLRLPNSLRFKVRPDESGKLRGLICHFPCLPPPAFKPDRQPIEQVWRKVHEILDAAPNLSRVRA